MKKVKTIKNEEVEGQPLCKECGNLMVEENGEWLCTHCDTEIDFFGDEDNE